MDRGPTENSLREVMAFLRRVGLSPRDYYNIASFGLLRIPTVRRVRALVGEFYSGDAAKLAQLTAMCQVPTTEANFAIRGMVARVCVVLSKGAVTIEDFDESFDDFVSCVNDDDLERAVEEYYGDGVSLSDRWYRCALEFVD